nr:DnaJ homolog subfamily C member 17 [Ipomoea batatas]
MEISSLARSFPGHSLLPAPNGRNVPAFGVKFCTNFNSSEAVSRTEFLPWKKPISPVLFSRFVRCLPSGEEGANLSDKQIAKAYRVKALELHPDKRPNDPNANIFFQKLKASYEILRDRKARREYDDVLKARQFRAKHKRKQEEELASMNAKRRAAAATPPPGWKEENEDGPWKSLERFQAYEDLVLGNMRRAAERQKMAQRGSNGNGN